MRCFVSLAALLIASPLFAADIWFEGESATKHNFSNKAFAPATLEKPDVLSNRDWLNNAGKRGPDVIFAEYKVDIPGTAKQTLQFWTRKFWKHGPFRWRFGDQPWQTCGKDVALADEVSIQKFVGANWVYLGQVDLAPGSHTLRIELLAQQGEDAVACFDAFLLTNKMFLPRGKMKPGETYNAKEPGWFAFEPTIDDFSPDAFSLRSLNEKIAGETGFIKTLKANDATDFALGNGSPVRFFGVNVGPDIVRLAPMQVDYLAASLAKRGVNCVRIHAPLFDPAVGSDIDSTFFAQYHYFIAALKKQGIYTNLSIYFPLWSKNRPFAQIFFDDTMQKNYRDGWRKLLTTPHNGITLANEPAVAMLELVNEDSLFFWTFTESNIPAEKWAALEKKFAAHLANKYGSTAKAYAAIGGKHKRDGVDRAGLYEAWHMTADGFAKAPKKQRMQEQIAFLAETQRSFYADTRKFLRDDVKTKSLVVASNWITADPAALDPVERYTYAATDIIDRHGYFGGKHDGPAASYSVSKNDTYADRSGLLNPFALPIQFVQSPQHPMIISELGWPKPNRFIGESVALSAAAGAIQGADGLFFFAINSPAWSESNPKFAVSTPAVLGQFWANALLYRRGDIATPAPVVRHSLTESQLFSLDNAGPLSAQALDALREADARGQKSSGKGDTRFDPLAFYVGPVQQQVGSTPPINTDFASSIDRTKKLIRSQNGQLTWHYGEGRLLIDAPRHVAAIGAINKTASRFGPITINTRNDFAAIHIVSLDNQPLATSRRMLLQAFTEEKTFGWSTSADETKTITDLGGPPQMIKNIEAQITIPARRATVLDANGTKRQQLKVEGNTITLPPDAMYILIEN